MEGWGQFAAIQTESIGEEQSEMAGSLTQIQQVWILMRQQRNKSRAQWVIDHTWISSLPVNSLWVMDKPGLWSGPTALYSVGKRVCVHVCEWFVGEWVCELMCVWVYLKSNTVCVCVCVSESNMWAYLNMCADVWKESLRWYFFSCFVQIFRHLLPLCNHSYSVKYVLDRPVDVKLWY